MKLIHAVNPTARDLPGSDRQRRYLLKARLQSLLIRRFPNELQVISGDAPGVVSLLHVYAGMDACHAVLDELEEDARSWVTFQLDTGAGGEIRQKTSEVPAAKPSPSEPAGVAQGGEVSTLLAAGERALAEYDFEQAAAQFERALEANPGSIAATRALLELWIDRLAADGEALGLEARLPRATLADPEIRILLATAAARTGDLKHAERLLRGIDDPRVAEVAALGAHTSVKLADHDSAALWMAQLRSLDPMHPAIVECERELRKQHDAACLADETELQRLVARGEFDDAERWANQLLRRWPHSETAACWLRQRSSERAQLAACLAIDQAERERERGAVREALLILSSALVPALDAEPRAALQRKISELERQVVEQSNHQRIGEVSSALARCLGRSTTSSPGESSLESAVVAYLELPAELRERAREHAGLPELAWVEPILARQGTKRAKLASAAILELVEVRGKLETNPTEALILLQSHVEALESMPESSKLLAVVRRGARLKRQSVAAEQLRQAEEALAESNANRALQLLDAISAEDLDPRGCERRRELLSTARDSSERQMLRDQLEALHRAGDLFGARDTAKSLADGTEGDERDAWLARRDAIRKEIRQAWCHKSGIGDLPGAWLFGISGHWIHSAPQPWLEDGGQTALWVAATGRWLMLARIRLESGTVNGWVRMLLPKDAHRVEIARITDQVVVLVTDELQFLSLELESWEILHYQVNLRPPKWGAEQWVVSRDGRWLWCAQEDRSSPQWDRRVRVIGTTTHRVARDFAGAHSVVPVVGSHDAEVVVVDDYGASFHRPRGTPISGLETSDSLTAAVQAPSGTGLVGTFSDDDRDARLVLLGPMQPGKLPPELVLEQSAGEKIHQLAVALDRGLLVARYYVDDSQWLEGFAEQGGHLVSLYRVPVSAAAALLTDRAGRRLWLLDRAKGELVARELGPEPPQLPFDHVPRRYLPMALADSWECAHANDEPESHDLTVPITTHADVWNLVRRIRSEGPSELPATFQRAHRLSRSDDQGELGSLLKLALVWAFPDEPNSRLTAANQHILSQEWDKVYRCLRGVDLKAMSERRRQHGLHLLAWCALIGRHFDLARELRAEAGDLNGSCDLRSMDRYMRPLDDEPIATPFDNTADIRIQWDSSVAVLRRALRDADALLRAGNPRAAFEAAALPELFFWREEHLLACAAEALMQFDPESESEQLRREHVLGTLLDAELDPYAISFKVSVPEAWDATRTAEVRTRAARQFALDMGSEAVGARKPVDATSESEGAAVDATNVAWPPPLGHERLMELHPGLLPGFEQLLKELRRERTPDRTPVFSETELLADPRVWPLLEVERARLSKEDAPRTDATSGLAELAPHLAYLVNHCLAGRTSYWVGAALARSLRGSESPAALEDLLHQRGIQSFAFTDRDTLRIAEGLLARDKKGPLAGKSLAALSAYAWPITSTSGPWTLAVRLLFIPEEHLESHRLARELVVDPDSGLDALLFSHRKDRLEAALDPMTDAPELQALLNMLIRLILHVAGPKVELRELGDHPSEPANNSDGPQKGAGRARTADRLLVLTAQ